jgi:hypothetical protein
MSFNWANFNADEIDTEGFKPVPAGWYPAMVVKSEMKTTKAGGEMLVLQWDILEGQYKGRKIFCNLNLKNDNKQAEEIAHRELASICKCIGIIHPRGSEELHNKPMMIKLAVRPETEQFPASNDIKGYEVIQKQNAAAPTSGVVFAPTVASNPIPVTLGTPTDGKKPWEA